MVDKSSIDREFTRKLTEIIHANLSDENFGVNELVRKSGYSHYVLSRKLHSITGKTIIQFIREARLCKAFEMLQENNITAAEVAYRTGFGSATYFNTTFNDYFGYPPGKVKKGEFRNPCEDNAVPIVKNKIQTKRLIIFSSEIIISALVVFLIYHFAFSGSSDRPKKSSLNSEKTVVVLPFKNLSDSTDYQYFANGITEDILTLLCKIRDLRVISYTKAEKLSKSNSSPLEIAAKLKAHYLVDGSIQKLDNKYRIWIQLVDVKAGQQLWSDAYYGKYTTEIFEFQSSIAKKVALSLDAIITPQDEKRIDVIPTTQMVAHELDLKAREIMNGWYYSRDSLDLRHIINLVNQALKVDPEYINALNTKATIYAHSGNYDSALYYYNKILKIDPENALSFHGIAGVCFFKRIMPDSALFYALKAEKLLPNYYWNNLLIGQIYCMQKNDLIKGLIYYNKSIVSGGGSEHVINYEIARVYNYINYYSKDEKYLKKAIFFKPQDFFIKNYGLTLLTQGKYNECFNFLDSISSITRCEQVCDMVRFHIYITQKEFEKAEKYYNLSVTNGYSPTIDDRLYLAYLYNETFRKKEASTILYSNINFCEKLIAIYDSWTISYLNMHLTAAYAMLDEDTKALKCLSEVERTGPCEHYILVKSSPGFDKLRSNPEFQSILKRIEDKKAYLRAQVKEMELRGEIDL